MYPNDWQSQRGVDGNVRWACHTCGYVLPLGYDASPLACAHEALCTSWNWPRELEFERHCLEPFVDPSQRGGADG